MQPTGCELFDTRETFKLIVLILDIIKVFIYIWFKHREVNPRLYYKKIN